MSRSLFSSDLILFLNCCQAIGSICESNSTFQVQLTDSILAFCQSNQIAIGQVTIGQLIELLEIETEKFNGGAA